MTRPSLDNLAVGETVTLSDGSTLTIVDEQALEEEEEDAATISGPPRSKRKKMVKNKTVSKKNAGEGGSSLTKAFPVPKKFTPTIDQKLKTKNAIFKNTELSKYVSIFLSFFVVLNNLTFTNIQK